MQRRRRSTLQVLAEARLVSATLIVEFRPYRKADARCHIRHAWWHSRLQLAALRTGSSLASASSRPSYTKLGAPMPRPRRPPSGAAPAATDLLPPDTQRQAWAAGTWPGPAEVCGCLGGLWALCCAACRVCAPCAGAHASKQRTLRPQSAVLCWLGATLHMLRFAVVPELQIPLHVPKLRC